MKASQEVTLRNHSRAHRIDRVWNSIGPHLAWYAVVGPERPDPEALGELVLLPDLERHELVVEVGLVHGAVHVEEPPHEVREAGGDEDGGRAHPPAAPRGDVHWEAPDVVHVCVGYEEEVLRDGERRAPADVEGKVEGGERDAGLVPGDGDALHAVALDLQSLLHRPRPPGGGGGGGSGR